MIGANRRSRVRVDGGRAAPWIVGALVAQRLGEVRMAKRNEATARAAGAVEFGASHYPLFFVLHPAWLIGIVAESRRAGRPVRPGWLLAAALMQPLRVSTMKLLGDQWTTRVLITPGKPRVTRGLYRWFKHPAYAAVTLELLATPLAVGARRTAAGGTIANALLLGLLRLPAERRGEATRTPGPNLVVVDPLHALASDDQAAA